LIAEFETLKVEVEARWEELLDADYEGETKLTQFNLNERVFNIAIKNHLSDIECLENCRLYWDKPWGGAVIVKLNSTKA